MAVERGIAHAQLPIGQYLQMKTRKVLTINHGWVSGALFFFVPKAEEIHDWFLPFLLVFFLFVFFLIYECSL